MNFSIKKLKITVGAKPCEEFMAYVDMGEAINYIKMFSLI